MSSLKRFQLTTSDTQLRTLLYLNLNLAISSDLKQQYPTGSLEYKLLSRIESDTMRFEKKIPALFDHPLQDAIMAFFTEVDEAYERFKLGVERQVDSGDGLQPSEIDASLPGTES